MIFIFDCVTVQTENNIKWFTKDNLKFNELLILYKKNIFLLFMMDDNFFYAHRRKNTIHSAVVD